MRSIVLAILAAALASGCAPDRASQAAVQRLLDQQARAWNRGDVDGYMDGYWRSPELTFSSGGRTQYGWDATRDRYRARYPTPADMGQLTFSDLAFRRLGSRAMLVLGRWRLQRAADDLRGNFSLIVERFGGRWLITHDHSSLQPAEEPRP